MNGFESSKVLHAYDLVGAVREFIYSVRSFTVTCTRLISLSFQVGDSFDDLLAFLLSTTT